VFGSEGRAQAGVYVQNFAIVKPQCRRMVPSLHAGESDQKQQ